MGSIAQRHKYILDKLKQDGYVKVKELSDELKVSEVTIRKDLKFLESKKVLSRNYGSASTPLTIIPDRHIDEKGKLQVDEKNRIAIAAKELLQENDTIVIASGTTTLTFANVINDINFPISVITPTVKVTMALCYNPNIEIIQLGGVIRKNAASVAGNDAENMLGRVMCNKLFFGVDGIDIDYGLTTSALSEAYLHESMIEVAQEVIVLADSTKFGRKGFCKICDIDKIHHIITDTNAPHHIVKMLEEKGIRVTLV